METGNHAVVRYGHWEPCCGEIWTLGTMLWCRVQPLYLQFPELGTKEKSDEKRKNMS